MSARRIAAFVAFGVVVLAGCSSTSDGTAESGTPSSTSPTASVPASSSSVAPATTAPAPTTTAVARSTTSAASKPTATPTPAPKRSPAATAGRLPLDLTTRSATQVITVVADSSSDTRATLQRWRKSDGGWRKVGSAVDAYLGSAGIGKAREGSTKTPAGSFTLTQAFGRDGDPGTRLPYLRTTANDYWISSPGPDYNTEQRCGNCGYDNGLNERLHDVTPEYDHAVVIDYNTRNAPGGVTQGRGSAFFLHIEAGEPTAGCVAIPRGDLVAVMSWLRPSDDPRILIGVR